jgi:phosphoribosylaminoimidazole carboxylase (NCAIR synthetase)
VIPLISNSSVAGFKAACPANFFVCLFKGHQKKKEVGEVRKEDAVHCCWYEDREAHMRRKVGGLHLRSTE